MPVLLSRLLLSTVMGIEFDRRAGRHPGILSPIFDRLIGHHSVRTAGNVVARSTVVCHCELNIILFAEALCASPLTVLALYFARCPGRFTIDGLRTP
jgi:hypothetical protein